MGLIGTHRLEVEADGPRETLDGDEQFHVWRTVETLALTASRLFINVGAVQAHVVPLAQSDAGEAGRLINALRSRVQALPSPA